MSLAEHLRELRSRMLKSTLAVLIGTVVAWIYYQEIFHFLESPLLEIQAELAEEGQVVQPVITGVLDAFTLQLKICAAAGFIAASPIWLYQMWRFVTPGLRKKERRWAILFVAVALPLFLGGVAFAYYLMPQALKVLFQFTPENVDNLPSVDEYLSFFLRLVFVFGISFLSPLVIVGLNLFGVLSGRALVKAWRFILFGVFVFAAIATPTADPINLLLLAGPILILVGLALCFCFLNDRRRRRRDAANPDFNVWADDETSPL